MFLVVKGFDTLSLHPLHTGVELLIIASRRNSPEKKLTLTKLANYRNVWFEELPVPRGRNKKRVIRHPCVMDVKTECQNLLLPET
jgi:hypothetical protein